MQLDEVADDREPEPEAAVRARRRAVGLAEALEDVGRNSGFMPFPLSLTPISNSPSRRAERAP